MMLEKACWEWKLKWGELGCLKGLESRGAEWNQQRGGALLGPGQVGRQGRYCKLG